MLAGIVLLAFQGSVRAAEENGASKVLWQIGAPDGSCKEFAFVGKGQQLVNQFGPGTVLQYEIGKSNPGHDWPYYHPCPQDDWAHGSTQKRTILFNLSEAPSGRYWLRLDLVDAASVAPSFEVTLNGQSGRLEGQPGSGIDRSGDKGKAQRVDLELPASLLQKGKNQLTLFSDRGGWAAYDDLTLRQDPGAQAGAPKIVNFTLTPTLLFVRREGKLLRVVDAMLTLDGFTDKVSFHIEAPEAARDIVPGQRTIFGPIEQELLIPDSETPTELHVTAVAGGDSRGATVKVDPCRKWKIFVAASAHTDIGYTDMQPRIAELHAANIDEAMELIKLYPDFRWNTEGAWQMEKYLEIRPEPKREQFLQSVRDGKLGVQALYANMLTGLLSDQAATRLTWTAAQAHRDYGIPYDSAMISDVPSQEASFPTIMADAGIRYLSCGMNRARAQPFNKLNEGFPYWWEGLDGSRVMMVFASSYAQAHAWLLDRDLGAVVRFLPTQLDKFAAHSDYPYDAVFLHGAVTDNHPLESDLARLQQQWNQRYAYPQIIYCTNDAFFKYLEANYDVGKLPVVRGSGGDYWEDGAGSTAQETRLCRNAQEMLTDAEKLLTLSRVLDPQFQYPADQIAQAWRNCLLFDEHTWGYSLSITKPEGAQTKAVWQIKAQYALNANQSASALLEQGVKTLASHVKHDGPALIVVNPSSWPRTDLIRVESPEGLVIADPAAKACRTADGTYVLVKDVPACGYRAIKLAPAIHAPTDQEEAQGTTLESRFYRVSFDPATGSITSVVDKETCRELVDAKTPYHLNEYLYVASKADTSLESIGKKAPELQISTPQKASLKRFQLGELGERMIVETSCTQTPKIVSTITVWNDVKRVDIEIRYPFS